MTDTEVIKFVPKPRPWDHQIADVESKAIEVLGYIDDPMELMLTMSTFQARIWTAVMRRWAQGAARPR